MFFLIFARDPELVKNEFRKYGVIVRNKTKDIKGAIRISIINKESIDYTLDIIKKINE